MNCRIIAVAAEHPARYPSPAAAQSAAGPGNPQVQKALQQRPDHQLQVLFLCLRSCVMAAVRGRPSGLPGSFCLGFPARVQLPPFRLETKTAASSSKRSHAMYVFHRHQPQYPQQTAGGAQ
ncbi:ash family protein [Pseudomonas protegens]|nr:ash family protein [Pseudomonas protegens]MBP5119186.1 ash family protein [Pseudomonas protegens]QTU10128.1 ash family protein [Pseudomonas protegens]QTU16308.1 ash family protein [Pseudomonas protegens]QTU22783.1 ash family protein [Pseudomonas protegens]